MNVKVQAAGQEDREFGTVQEAVAHARNEQVMATVWNNGKVEVVFFWNVSTDEFKEVWMKDVK